MLIAKGAEAYLYREQWNGYDVIRKKRIRKTYRHPALDMKIRKRRTIIEARVMNEARAVGVPTPIVLNVDLKETTIIYEFIEGIKVKQVLDKLPEKNREKINQEIGAMIGGLHKNNLIHGDLTTSNMIITPKGNIYLIDFGLSLHSSNIEDKGVDLHLLKRALESTHYTNADKSYKQIIKGYIKSYGKEALNVVKRVSLIEKRGRYISERE
ncbi:MAG: KEOPS complex kinase/ATPase Bud32 [Candidatus Odinarchaeia archaeon]